MRATNRRPRLSDHSVSATRGRLSSHRRSAVPRRSSRSISTCNHATTMMGDVDLSRVRLETLHNTQNQPQLQSGSFQSTNGNNQIDAILESSNNASALSRRPRSRSTRPVKRTGGPVTRSASRRASSSGQQSQTRTTRRSTPGRKRPRSRRGSNTRASARRTAKRSRASAASRRRQSPSAQGEQEGQQQQQQTKTETDNSGSTRVAQQSDQTSTSSEQQATTTTEAGKPEKESSTTDSTVVHDNSSTNQCCSIGYPLLFSSLPAESEGLASNFLFQSLMHGTSPEHSLAAAYEGFLETEAGAEDEDASDASGDSGVLNAQSGSLEYDRVPHPFEETNGNANVLETTGESEEFFVASYSTGEDSVS